MRQRIRQAELIIYTGYLSKQTHAIYANARREIAGWGKQGRKLVGEVVVADALAPEAARRAQR